VKKADAKMAMKTNDSFHNFISDGEQQKVVDDSLTKNL